MSSDRRVEAAGGVLWRSRRDAVEVCLVHRPAYDDWSLPKGKLARGEHPMLAALREVQEETAYTARPGPPLGEVHYDADGRPKRVRYWTLEALDGEGRFAPNDEVDELRWLTPRQALDLLSQDRDRDVLDAYLSLPLRTTALLVVRHADAGKRGGWPADDDLRPLQPHGRRQAEVLAELLAAYGPQQLLSADVRRCAQTLEPLARRTGLPLESEHLLSQRGAQADPQAADHLLRGLSLTGRSVVVCTQRGPLPALVQRLHEHLTGRPLELAVPPKGAVVAVHLAAHRLVAVEVLPAA